MSWFVSALVAGITAFVATNLDDILILMIFFAQMNATFRPRHIVAGQYLGFCLLLLASLPGYFGGLIVPKEWIGLLGFVPIAIGITHLMIREADEKTIKTISNEVNHPSVNASCLPSAFSSLGHLFTPQTYHVAAVTIANGGDNVGIYVPLFASSHLASLGVILTVFGLMVGVWCYIAYQFTRHPIVAQALTHHGRAIVPFILIALGLYILLESGSFQLVRSLIPTR